MEMNESTYSDKFESAFDDLLTPLIVSAGVGNALAIDGDDLIAEYDGLGTLTRRYVEHVQGTRARIIDTRKTTPGLRVLEKYAVRMGGAHNHRHGLDDLDRARFVLVERAVVSDGAGRGGARHVRRAPPGTSGRGPFIQQRRMPFFNRIVVMVAVVIARSVS